MVERNVTITVVPSTNTPAIGTPMAVTGTATDATAGVPLVGFPVRLKVAEGPGFDFNTPIQEVEVITGPGGNYAHNFTFGTEGTFRIQAIFDTAMAEDFSAGLVDWTVLSGDWTTPGNFALGVNSSSGIQLPAIRSNIPPLQDQKINYTYKGANVHQIIFRQIGSTSYRIEIQPSSITLIRRVAGSELIITQITRVLIGLSDPHDYEITATDGIFRVMEDGVLMILMEDSTPILQPGTSTFRFLSLAEPVGTVQGEYSNVVIRNLDV